MPVHRRSPSRTRMLAGSALCLLALTGALTAAADVASVDAPSTVRLVPTPAPGPPPPRPPTTPVSRLG